MDPRVAQKIQAFDQEPWIPLAWRRNMKRGALALLVVSSALAVIMWQRYVDAPSPREICEHKIALARAETAQQARKAGAKLIEKLGATCQSAAQRRIRLEGKVAYARFARCVIAANTLEQTERC